MYPPENHGSYGGKCALRRIALRWANSIGFSPPQSGCHESGLTKRNAKKTAKTTQNTASGARKVRRRALIDVPNWLRLDTRNATQATNVIDAKHQIARNRINSRLARIQTRYPASNIVISRASPHPRSGNRGKR